MNEMQLKIFIQAADCKSMTKAAETLFLSPPAVMNQVNSLESDLGVKLFERSPRGIFLTKAGKSAYKDAKILLANCDKLVHNARKAAAQTPFVIRVGTSFLAPCKELMDFWEKENDSFPQFKMEIIPFEYTNDTIVPILQNLGSDFDLIVCPCDSIHFKSICNFYKLGEYHISLAVPYNHPLAKKSQVALEDLYGETLLMPKSEDSVIMQRICEEIKEFHPQIRLESTVFYYDFHIFNQCIQQHCTMLTLTGWKDIHPSLKTIPIKWDYTIPYGLLYPLEPTEDVLHFLDIIKR